MSTEKETLEDVSVAEMVRRMCRKVTQTAWTDHPDSHLAGVALDFEDAAKKLLRESSND